MTTRSKCPLNHAVEVFGDKWTLLVLRDIMFNNRRSFSDLRKMKEGIATNILSDRLTRLEAAGLVERRADARDRRKSSYLPTKDALSLIPVLVYLMVWSRRREPGLDRAPDALLKGAAEAPKELEPAL